MLRGETHNVSAKDVPALQEKIASQAKQHNEEDGRIYDKTYHEEEHAVRFSRKGSSNGTRVDACVRS